MKEGQEPGALPPGSWRTGDAVRIGDRWRGRFMSGFGHPASYSALVALRRALIKGSSTRPRPTHRSFRTPRSRLAWPTKAKPGRTAMPGVSSGPSRKEVDLSEYLDYHDTYHQIGRFLDDVYMHKRIHSGSIPRWAISPQPNSRRNGARSMSWPSSLN
jgi:hypothetical protein